MSMWALLGVMAAAGSALSSRLAVLTLPGLG